MHSDWLLKVRISCVSIYQTSRQWFLCTLIGYSSSGYPVLVYTKPVNSGFFWVFFCMLWLATQAWDIYWFAKKNGRARVITFPDEFWQNKNPFLSLAIQKIHFNIIHCWNSLLVRICHFLNGCIMLMRYRAYVKGRKQNKGSPLSGWQFWRMVNSFVHPDVYVGKVTIHIEV